LVAHLHPLNKLEKGTLTPFTFVCIPAGYGRIAPVESWIANLRKTDLNHQILCSLSLGNPFSERTIHDRMAFFFDDLSANIRLRILSFHSPGMFAGKRLIPGE
jgi:hypothetical protein